MFFLFFTVSSVYEYKSHKDKSLDCLKHSYKMFDVMHIVAPLLRLRRHTITLFRSSNEYIFLLCMFYVAIIRDVVHYVHTYRMPQYILCMDSKFIKNMEFVFFLMFCKNVCNEIG